LQSGSQHSKRSVLKRHKNSSAEPTKTSKLIQRLETKHHHQSPHKRFSILPRPWSEFESQRLILPEVFTKNTSRIWTRNGNCPAENLNNWRNTCETLFLEDSKTTSWSS